MKFPYEFKPALGFGNIPTIKLKLKVKTPKGFTSLLFLFDTGADVSSLPKTLAKTLGVDLQNCPEVIMSGYSGESVNVTLSKIIIKLGQESFAIPCVFSSHEKVPIILGRAGILSRFNIFLKAREKQIIFEDIN